MRYPRLSRSSYYADQGSRNLKLDADHGSRNLRRADSNQDDYFTPEDSSAHRMRVKKYLNARESNDYMRMTVRSESPQPLTCNQYLEID